MAIALTAALPILPGFDSGRRTQSSTQSRPESQNQQSQASQNRNERVVRGEVISARDDSRRSINSTERTVSERNAAFNSFGEPRRFSLQSSIATYQQNEALIVEPGKPRQVSGIIDEFV